MGNLMLKSNLKSYSVYRPYSVHQQWQSLHQQKSSPIFKLVKSRKNPFTLGQLHISKEVIDLENILKILQFRNNFCQSQIVGIYGVYLPEISNKNSIDLCSNHYEFQVVTQNVVYCLSDLGQIQFQNAVFILKSVLKGAKLIKQNLNFSAIYDESMIFFDENSNCKVWISPDVNENNFHSHYSSITQWDSVNSIFSAVQQKVKYQSRFQRYLQLKSCTEIQSFKQAIQFLNGFQSQQIILVQNKFTSINKFQSTSSVNFQNNRNSVNSSQIKNKNVFKKSLSTNKIKMQSQAGQYFSAKKVFSSQSNFLYNLKQTPKSSFTDKLNFKQKNLTFTKKNTKLHQNPSCFKNLGFDKEPKLDKIQSDYKGNLKLKKQVIKKDTMKQKYIELKLKDYDIISKPSSTLSTHYDSTQIRSIHPFKEVEGKVNFQINFTKKNVHKINFIVHNQSQEKNHTIKYETLKKQTDHPKLVKNLEKIQEFYCYRKQDMKRILSQSQIYEQNKKIHQQNKQNKKVSLSKHTSRLKKQFSSPAFQRLTPLLSA